jgi:mannose-6-phosphate isomerase
VNPGAIPLLPALKEVLWGGRQLQRRYGKDAPLDRPLGEAWEVSCLPGMESRDIRDGRSLAEIFAADPVHVLGPLAGNSRFPFLVKLLATAQKLSVQVHPDEEGARRRGRPGHGKREAWLVLEAEPGAGIHLGLGEGVGIRDFQEAVAQGDADRCEQLMRWVEPSAGDVIDVLPGTLHCIGPGLVLLEVQQPSDLTYRLYDWGRDPATGGRRPLHLEDGLSVLRPDQRPMPEPVGEPSLDGPGLVRLRTPHFSIEQWRVQGVETVVLRRMLAMTVLGGEGELQSPGGEPIPLSRGLSVLVPRGSALARIAGRGLELAVVAPEA